MILFLALIFNMTANAEEFQKLITVGSFYETNTYFESTGAKGDFLTVIRPEVIYDDQNKKGFNFSGYGKFEYDYFLLHGNQSFYDYDLFLKGHVFSSDTFEFYTKPFIKTTSEPAFNITTSRLMRQYMGGLGGLTWRWSDLVKLGAEISFTQETQNQPEFNFQANQDMSVDFKHIYSFLPETSLVSRFLVGQKVYPNGLINENSIANRVKYSSQYFELGSGVIGRLTRSMKVNSYAGFLYRAYQKSVSFSEPVFRIEFEEERSPRDMILLGYDYRVEDSYTYSNYVLKQKMYIGFGRIFGDQLLALAQLSYNYFSYSNPTRREDQRLDGEFKLDYSFSSNFKAEGILRFRILTSDTMAITDLSTGVLPADPSVDYSFLRFGFFLKYLM